MQDGWSAERSRRATLVAELSELGRTHPVAENWATFVADRLRPVETPTIRFTYVWKG